MIEDKLNSREYEIYIQNCKKEGLNPNNLVNQFLYLAKIDKIKSVEGKVYAKANSELDDLARKKTYAFSNTPAYPLR